MRKKLKVLKAKLKNKNRVFVKTSMRVQRETTDKATIVRINNLIGALKLKLINMKNTQFPTRRGAGSESSLSLKFDYCPEDTVSPNDDDDMQKTVVIRNGQRMSPLKMNQALEEAANLSRATPERLKVKQDTLLDALNQDSCQSVPP